MLIALRGLVDRDVGGQLFFVVRSVGCANWPKPRLIRLGRIEAFTGYAVLLWWRLSLSSGGQASTFSERQPTAVEPHTGCGLYGATLLTSLISGRHFCPVLCTAFLLSSTSTFPLKSPSATTSAGVLTFGLLSLLQRRRPPVSLGPSDVGSLHGFRKYEAG